MKNKLSDVHNHLMCQLERLNDEDLSEKELKKEVERSKAMAGITNQIINNAKIQVEAVRVSCEYNLKKTEMPILLEGK